MAHDNSEVEVEVSVSSSASFKARRSKPNEDAINLFPGSDPVRLELNRLENELRGSVSILYFITNSLIDYDWKWNSGAFAFACVDKDRELGEALAEIKFLKNSERLKHKAVEEVFSLL